MPGTRERLESLRRAIRGTGAGIRGFSVASKDLGARALRPKRFEEMSSGATRVGQVVAFILLAPLIPVNFVIIVVMNNIMATILGSSDYSSSGEQGSIIGFLITLLTLGMLMLSAWVWFQWVRTAGFGQFNMGTGDTV